MYMSDSGRSLASLTDRFFVIQIAAVREHFTSAAIKAAHLNDTVLLCASSDANNTVPYKGMQATGILGTDFASFEAETIFNAGSNRTLFPCVEVCCCEWSIVFPLPSLLWMLFYHPDVETKVAFSSWVAGQLNHFLVGVAITCGLVLRRPLISP